MNTFKDYNILNTLESKLAKSNKMIYYLKSDTLS